MALDAELTGILREVIQFLECLREVKLPVTLESIRDNLLTRSKDTLTTFMVERIGRPGSPEAYLNMNAGSKGLMASKGEFELQEYVGAEDPRLQKQQDYYETFQEVESTHPLQDSRPNSNWNDIENTLVDIYSCLSASQVKNTCQKCGPLYRKDGKKLFVFEQYRACWVGLVGSHLLIYGNDRECRPYAVQPIRGYMARAAPNAIPRDPRRSESAFEIFCPGSRTLQFLAKTPSDMELWVAKICQVYCGTKEEYKITLDSTNASSGADVSKETREDSKCKVEVCQAVGSLGTDKIIENIASTTPCTEISIENSSPPSLPARIPRRLPSLPSTDRRSFEHPEDEDDDIYHKIEDLKDSMHYQNLGKKSMAKKSTKTKMLKELETYDDVSATTKKEKTNQEEKLKERSLERTRRKSFENETYDDIMSKGNIVAEERDRPVTYYDVENTISNRTKSPQKKSFLDRVRSMKESPRKTDKKAKFKNTSQPASIIETLPTYDDVSDLINTQDIKSVEEEVPEYNCPPPPRPIFVESTTVPYATEIEEFYDEVGSCREKCNEDLNKVRQTVSGQKVEQLETIEECEHYQTPRNELCQQNHVFVDQQEELYDEVAILADFTARRRVSPRKKEFEDSKSLNNLEKRPWNRFVTGRRLRLSESTGSETNSKVSNNDIDDTDDGGEHHSLIRMNTFQKLISKMENSLGKATSKVGSPVSPNKSSLTNT